MRQRPRDVLTRCIEADGPELVKIKCYEASEYEVAAVLREPGRPNGAYMVTPDKERDTSAERS